MQSTADTIQYKQHLDSLTASALRLFESPRSLHETAGGRVGFVQATNVIIGHGSSSIIVPCIQRLFPDMQMCLKLYRPSTDQVTPLDMIARRRRTNFGIAVAQKHLAHLMPIYAYAESYLGYFDYSELLPMLIPLQELLEDPKVKEELQKSSIKEDLIADFVFQGLLALEEAQSIRDSFLMPEELASGCEISLSDIKVPNIFLDTKNKNLIFGDYTSMGPVLENNKQMTGVPVSTTRVFSAPEMQYGIVSAKSDVYMLGIAVCTFFGISLVEKVIWEGTTFDLDLPDSPIKALLTAMTNRSLNDRISRIKAMEAVRSIKQTRSESISVVLDELWRKLFTGFQHVLPGLDHRVVTRRPDAPAPVKLRSSSVDTEILLLHSTEGFADVISQNTAQNENDELSIDAAARRIAEAEIESRHAVTAEVLAQGKLLSGPAYSKRSGRILRAALRLLTSKLDSDSPGSADSFDEKLVQQLSGDVNSKRKLLVEKANPSARFSEWAVDPQRAFLLLHKIGDDIAVARLGKIALAQRERNLVSFGPNAHDNFSGLAISRHADSVFALNLMIAAGMFLLAEPQITSEPDIKIEIDVPFDPALPPAKRQKLEERPKRENVAVKEETEAK